MSRVSHRTDTLNIGDVGQFAAMGTFLHLEVQDASGAVVSGYDAEGRLHVRALQVSEINGLSPNALGSAGARAGARLTADWNMTITTGQSLGEGSTPAASLTTAQEYDSVGFAGQASDYSARSLLPLTTANCAVPSRGESPMFGTAGAVKALLASENGLDPADLTYQLIGVNQAYSGYKIDQLVKGQAPFTRALSAVSRAKVLAEAAGATFAVRAVTWTQGEGDGVVPTAFATYRDALIGVASDYDADCRGITGQPERVILICYQTATRDLTIAQAQLEAAQLSPLIMMACPMYQFTYGDSLHITAASSKWLGGYYGLAQKRVTIDGLGWEPLMPRAGHISGSVIDLTFNKSGLVFDTATLPAQSNQGFTVFNAAGVAQPIASVAILQPNRVRITLASGSPAAGWAVRYGHGNMTGRADAFIGGGGNLRDRAGDALTYNGNRMDNWAVIFNWTL